MSHLLVSLVLGGTTLLIYLLPVLCCLCYIMPKFAINIQVWDLVWTYVFIYLMQTPRGRMWLYYFMFLKAMQENCNGFIQLFYHHLLKKIILSSLNCLGTFSKSVEHMCVDLFVYSLHYFSFSIYFSLCQYDTVLITVAL